MVNPVIREIEQRQLRVDHYFVKVGDKISIHQRIIEGEKTRIQIYTGDVIAIKHGRENNRSTITVRKAVGGFGVERIFPLHSPMIEKIELINRGKVRRGKLYYQRKRSGVASKIKPRNYF